MCCAVLCLVARSCLTLCDPMDSSPPGFSVHGDSPGKNTGMGCHDFLQGIFPIQGSNPGLPHCRQILYHLSHQSSPYTYVQFSSVQSLSRVWLFVIPWTVAHQASLSMGTLQARTLEWVAMPSSSGSSQPRDWTQAGLPHWRWIIYQLSYQGSLM